MYILFSEHPVNYKHINKIIHFILTGFSNGKGNKLCEVFRMLGTHTKRLEDGF